MRSVTGTKPLQDQEAQKQGKALPFIQTGIQRDARQKKFVDEVENYDSGMQRGRTFETPEQLRTEITRAVSRQQLAAATTPVDVEAMLAAAKAVIPQENRNQLQMSGPLLHIAVAGGPSQTILRPSEIEAQNTCDELVMALYSPTGYFSYRLRTVPQIDSNALVITQENGAVFRIEETATMLLSIPIEQATGHLKPLIEEHVLSAIQTGLEFADQIFEKFDRTQRLTRTAVVASISSSGMFGWRTSSEQAASPDSMNISMSRDNPSPVHLNPADRTRMALRSDRAHIAEDLLALLRRQNRI